MPRKPPASAVLQISAYQKAITEAQTPEEIRGIEAKLEAAELYLRKSGWFANELRPINEARMRARWKLGVLLTQVAREKPRKGKLPNGGVMAFLKKMGLAPSIATECQWMAALPEEELERCLAKTREENKLNHFEDLLRWAKPFWVKTSRKNKHEKIAAAAEGKKNIVIETDNNGVSHFADDIGPFPLIYADPPWKFETRSENGLERSPDRHYPTMTDEEIISYLIKGKTISEIAHEKAALFLWCTSSNIPRALKVMECWGFNFTSSAVWLKDKVGLGYIFRNQHELLLYGTRGAMPAPQHQPSSVFAAPRLEHSAKPAIVREMIEHMYPDFDEKTRIELFAREVHPRWSCWGNEVGLVHLGPADVSQTSSELTFGS